MVDRRVEIRRLKVSEKLTAIGSNSQWKDPRVTLFTVSGETSHLNLRVENHSGSKIKLTAHWAVFLWAFVKKIATSMLVERLYLCLHEVPQHAAIPGGYDDKHLIFLRIDADECVTHLVIIIHSFPNFVGMIEGI